MVIIKQVNQLNVLSNSQLMQADRKMQVLLIEFMHA